MRAVLSLAALFALLPSAAAGEIRATAAIDMTAKGVRIAPEVYGHFAEELGSGIEGGIWVGENSPIPNIRGYRRDVVEALRALEVPVVRWPGGCYADIYNWRDGIGPRGQRPVTLNKWWGNNETRNRFGTHEFFDFAELIGAKTYLNINVGTGTPREAREWVEYVTSPSRSSLAELRRANGRTRPWKIDYLGIGNEIWGCGGNLKAHEFSPTARQYANFLREPGMILIAGGASGDDYSWTEAMLREHGQIDAISLHYYTLPTGDWSKKGAAVGFTEQEWASTFVRTRKLDEIIAGHKRVMDKADPEKKIGLMVAEWGTWYDPSPGSNPAFLVQENTLRDALVAAANFHIFHRHADRVRMANIAQMVNVLQSVILTDGARLVRTPTYYAFQMYRPFKGAAALPVTVKSPDYAMGNSRMPAVDVTAARSADGVVHLALVNVDPNQEAYADLDIAGARQGSIAGQLLTAARMESRNRFGVAEEVRPKPFSGARWRSGRLQLAVPPKSVVVLSLK
jgi:alpha-N-arabinofuranosidase